MPRSTISAESSGGVRSSATRTASTMTLTVSASASRISSSLMVMVLGTPSIRWRPLISIVDGLVERVRRADLDLDGLGGTLANEQVVGLLDVVDDRFIHLVAGHAHGLAVDDSGQRDHGDIGRAAADVDHHVARGLLDGQAGADGGRHRFLDQVHFTGLGAVGAVLHRALLDLRNFRRHADDDSRPHPHRAVVRLLDEVGQHLLGDVEVGDDAVLHRLDGHDVAGRAAQHLLGFASNGFDAPVHLVDRDNRRLVDDDALALGIDAGVGRAEVDGEVSRETRENSDPSPDARTAPDLARLATATPSFPDSLTRYMATSAARTSSSAELAASGSVATPTDTVSRTSRPSPARNTNSPHAFAHAVAHADRAFGAGFRQHDGKLVAAEAGHDVGFAGRSADDARRLRRAPGCPARWPCASLTRLKPSRSMKSSDSGRPLRDARFDSRRRT